MGSGSASRLLLALLLGLGAGALVAAQDQPLQAGSEGVPVPKKTKHVQPVYPAEALAQGIRGIVILDIVVDAKGKVTSTSVLRSVPGLDEAAIAAARQWEYEPTKVDGKPASVRLTVPITFSLALPRLARQSGIPELRQGVTPPFPKDASTSGSVSAEVTLESDGRIGVARLLSGEAPFSDVLLATLKTWRFSTPPEDATLSFRIEADFVKGKGSDPNVVDLRASGLERSELLADASSAPAAPQAPAASAPAPTAPAPAPTPTPRPTAPAPSTPAPAPGTSPPTPSLPGPPPPVPASPPAGKEPASGKTPTGSPASPPPSVPVPDASAANAPTTEVLTSPPPLPPPENGVSAVREVMLEPGVPDLARGRRPIVPPVARLSGTTGTVEVLFSVSAGGVTALQTATGPEMLRYSAEQTVASWVFSRTRAERAYLVATFTYGPDKGTAVVKPQRQEQPEAPAAAKDSPSPQAPPTPID